MKTIPSKSQGVGVGLRTQHYPAITQNWPKMDWFEAITENFMDSGGRPLAILEQVRAHYPVALHGTSLSIGSTDPLRPHYMKNWKKLVDRIDPFLVSDHLCWTSVDQEELHDLLPLPFTEEALKHVVERVGQVQDYLGRQIILENVSTYVTYKHSNMPEWEFLRELARRSGCGILLDINNIYVNAFNHKFDALDYLKAVPGDKVRQFHLAGHTDMGKYYFDTHTGHVIDPVWKLYEEALKLYGPVSTLIEWDADIPEFEVLQSEAEKARGIYKKFKTPSQDLAAFKPAEFSKDPDPVSLPEIERRMKSWVQPQRSQLDCNLNEQGGEPGNLRLSVYGEGYKARIFESLAEAFEAVYKVIGHDKFLELTHAYAAQYPSKHYNLNYAGKYFPDFLKQNEISKKFPFLIELAELEWAVMEVFDAQNEKPFDMSSLSGLSMEDWAKIRFAFQPHVFVYRASWPVLDIWKNRNGSDKPADGIKKQAQDILLFRVQTEIHSHVMASKEADLIQALRRGLSLGEACDKINLPEGEAGKIQQWFQFWVSAGLIQNCALPASAS